MYGIQNLWPALSEELGADVEYMQGENLRLGKNEAHMQKLTQLAENACGVGLDVRMVDAKEAHDLNPYLSPDVIGASWCPTDGHANPLKTTLAYYRRALANTVGVDLPLSLYFDEAVVTERQPHMFDMMLGVATGDFYGHHTVHGSFVFGSECGLEEYYENNASDLRTFFLTASSCCRSILGYFPVLANTKIIRTWGGWLDMCYDGVPVISAIDEVPGLIIAAGFCGHGFGTAPAVGLMLAQMALGHPTVVDLSSLSYDRFRAVK